MIRWAMPSKSICTLTGRRGARSGWLGAVDGCVVSAASASCRRWSRARRHGRVRRHRLAHPALPRPGANVTPVSSSLSGSNGLGSPSLEHREIQAEVLVVIVRRHVEPLRTQPEIGRREEPQILAAGVPHRPCRVRQAVGHLLRLTRLDVADEDRLVERVEMRRVGHVLGIGTPRRIHACAAAPSTDRGRRSVASPLATSSTHTLRLVSV